jgi:predicted GH43/DUF377 family glycosyl hydrolase
MFAKLPSKLALFSIVLAAILMAIAPGATAAVSRPGVWTKYAGNPVLDVGASGTWDDLGIWDPAVVFDGSVYHMWYSGASATTPSQIGYATSPDGLSWTRASTLPVLEPGPSGSWDEAGVRAASVISDSGVFKMWYTGFDADGHGRIGYATSPDGSTWTKDGANPVFDIGAPGTWDDFWVGEPAVVKDGSTYRLWYRGIAQGMPAAIGYATSPDGTTWIRYGIAPVLGDAPGGSWDYLVYAPNVLLDGGTVQMWYSGGNFAGTAWEIGYATSSDGVHWTKRGRVIQQGPDGSFDRYSADYPAVLQMDGTFQMWYSAVAADFHYRIGYASAPEIVVAQAAYLPIVLKNHSGCPPIWTDTFSDYRSGWYIEDQDSDTLAYNGGEYQMLVKQADAYLWSTPGVEMANGMIVVHMRFAGPGDGADNGGIMFGQSQQENEDFYRFTVQRDGHYCIQRHETSSGWITLSCGAAPGYLPYPATNELKVVRDGSAITAYLNGQFVATVYDNNYQGSLRVGLSAGTAAGGADLRFDDYGVYPLGCSDLIGLNAGGER